MNKLFLTLPVLALATMMATPHAYGRQLTLEEAMKNIPSSMMKNATRSGSDLVYTETVDNLNIVYVLCDGADSGYVVLGADDILPPILGYADSGFFDPDNIPPAMAYWLQDYGRQLVNAIEYGYTRADPYGKREAIAPLCKTKWSQDAPFSDKCPVINGKHAPVGCTATAMAQAIAVHKWPAKGKGTNSYTWNNQTYKFDFGATSFDWDNMLDVYSAGKYTQAQADAVATLSLACGNCALMGYEEKSSGAYPYNGLYGLVNFMDYDKSAYLAERKYFKFEVWNEMLYNELAAGRPIIYGGYNSNAGHTFIIDGYNGEGYYHLNWGWGGLSNGYFIITALDPDSQGTGGSAAGYNDGQSAMFNLMPAKSGSEYQTNIYCATGFSSKAKSYDKSKAIEFTCADSEYGYYDIFTLIDKKVTLGIILTPEAGGEGTFYPGPEYECKAHYGNQNYKVFSSYTVNASSLPSKGTYIATPAFKIDDKVRDIPVQVGTTQSLKFTCSSSKITIEDTPVVRTLTISDLKSETKCYVDHTCTFTAKISNKGEEFYGYLYPGLVSGGRVISWLDPVTVNLLDGDEANLTFSGKFINESTEKPVAAGDYTLNIYDENGKKMTTSALSVTLSTAPDPATSCSVTMTVDGKSSGNGTKSKPYLIGDNIKVNLKISVTSGLFDSTDVYLFAYLASNLNVGVEFGSGSQNANPYLVDSETPVTKVYNLNTSTFPMNEIVMIQAFSYDSSKNAWNKLGGNGSNFYFQRTTTGIELTEAEERGTISPNPAVGVTTVTALNPIRKIEIFSLSGTKVSEISTPSGSTSAEINVESLASGHYVVVVTTTEGMERLRLIRK